VNYQPNIAWSNADETHEEAAQIIQHRFLDQLHQKQTVEHHQGRTVVGPHRDEIDLQLNDVSARQFASQGQQRTLVLALKMAELKLIEAVVGEAPLLLLDDVLAELDLRRQHHLLDTIQDRFQTLITTTHVNSFDAYWLRSSQILAVKAGQISSYTDL
jgi:DNA replication and repair protein RecF